MIMAAQKKPADVAPDNPSSVSVEDVLKPFQDASAKFLQAKIASHEAAAKQHAQACIDVQDRIREVEQEAYRAVMEATKKHVEQMGQQPAASVEEMYFARARAQLDFEREVRQVHIDAQSKLATIAQKAMAEDAGGVVKGYTDQRQDAYQTYLADLQQAWSATKSLDPHTMSSIASNMMFAMHSG
jgi:hypothetical protein